jgi:hypothetical protein
MPNPTIVEHGCASAAGYRRSSGALLRTAPVIAFVLSLALALGAGMLHAQSVSELNTDRPDQTETAEAVPKGWLQIEVGAVFERAGDPPEGATFPPYGARNVRTWTAPAVLLRYGLFDDFELRLASAWVTESHVGSVGMDSSGIPERRFTERGSEPLAIGCKYQFTRDAPLGVAAILMLAVPSTVAGDFPANNAAGELRISLAKDLFPWLSIGMNLAAEHVLKESRVGLHYTLVAAFGLSERLGSFIELFGSRDTGEEQFRQRADGGCTFLITPDLQYDISAGVELNPRDDAGNSTGTGYFIGTGLSWRFPFTD